MESAWLLLACLVSTQARHRPWSAPLLDEEELLLCLTDWLDHLPTYACPSDAIFSCDDLVTSKPGKLSEPQFANQKDETDITNSLVLVKDYMDVTHIIHSIRHLVGA